MTTALRVLLALVLLGLAAALSLPFLAASRQRGEIRLLGVENELLRQENRALAQQLEAERLQAAALARRLQAAEATAAAR